MTPELLFDRPSLVTELGSSLIEWANEMIVILEEHRHDHDSIWVVEKINARSMQMGMPMTLKTHSSSGEEEEGCARTLGLKHCPGERAIFSFETDGSGYQEGIDAMRGLLDDVEKRIPPDKWSGPGMKLAHAMGDKQLLKAGWKAFAADPITIRIFDHVVRSSFDWHCRDPHLDIMLEMKSPKAGRGMTYLSDPVFQEIMEGRTPVIGNNRKSEAKAFDYFDLVRRIGILSAHGQRHEKGSLRGDMLFLDGLIPEAVMIGSSGKQLDDIVETPMTRGLGLKILSVEPSGGIRPGIAIRTDARDRLTIFKRRVD